MGLFCCLLGDELGGNCWGAAGGAEGGWGSLDWADVMFWRGGTISTRITLSPLSIYLSLSLHSPLLFISGERFSIYGPLLDHSNLESTAIPIRIVASGTSTITALPITLTSPQNPQSRIPAFLPFGNKASVCVRV